MEANFDSRAAATTAAATPAAAIINIQDPKTFNNATSTTAYDIKGQPVTVTYYFQKAATDKWNIYATANGQSINGITTPTAEAVTAMAPIATVTFPANGGNPVGAVGNVVPYTYSTSGTQTAGAAITTNGTFTLPDIPAVTLATGGVSEPITSVTLNLSGLTQNGATFGVTKANVDGNAPGKLTGISIENNGIVTARYSNGNTQSAGQIELANFRNPNGLQPMGGNGWGITQAAGDVVRNAPGDGSMGTLQAGALEESNVDLTLELVNMMTAQRVYQANAQTIKTQDQVMSTLVNLR
jgi:flagellar hook protein FlgE